MISAIEESDDSKATARPLVAEADRSKESPTDLEGIALNVMVWGWLVDVEASFRTAFPFEPETDPARGDITVRRGRIPSGATTPVSTYMGPLASSVDNRYSGPFNVVDQLKIPISEVWVLPITRNALRFPLVGMLPENE
jgi:hypothetical protein